LICFSYTLESFVLASIRMTRPTLALSYDLYAGAALMGAERTRYLLLSISIAAIP
jgi:hypothetical protein